MSSSGQLGLALVIVCVFFRVAWRISRTSRPFIHEGSQLLMEFTDFFGGGLLPIENAVTEVMSLFRLKIKFVTNIYLQPFPNHPFIAIFSLNFVIASVLRPRGCIDFERGLINLPFPAGPLLSQEGRYSSHLYKMES